MQGLGLLVLRWKQDAGAWAAGAAVETGSEGAASVATEGGGGGGGRVLVVSYWTISLN